MVPYAVRMINSAQSINLLSCEWLISSVKLTMQPKKHGKEIVLLSDLIALLCAILHFSMMLQGYSLLTESVFKKLRYNSIIGGMFYGTQVTPSF